MCVFRNQTKSFKLRRAKAAFKTHVQQFERAEIEQSFKLRRAKAAFKTLIVGLVGLKGGCFKLRRAKAAFKTPRLF